MHVIACALLPFAEQIQYGAVCLATLMHGFISGLALAPTGGTSCRFTCCGLRTLFLRNEMGYIGELFVWQLLKGGDETNSVRCSCTDSVWHYHTYYGLDQHEIFGCTWEDTVWPTFTLPVTSKRHASLSKPQILRKEDDIKHVQIQH